MIRRISFLLFIFAFSFVSVLAQEEQAEPEVPAGMEVFREGRLKVITPIDARKRREGILTVVEPTTTFVSRKVVELEERLASIETELEALKKQFEQFQDYLKE